MNSPSENSFNPAEFESLRKETLKQVEKDFSLQGFEIILTDRGQSYEQIVKLLSEFLEDRKLTGSNKLQGLLYQLDISEQFVREEILAKAENNRSSLLADAIIKRCFAKVVYRKKYS